MNKFDDIMYRAGLTAQGCWDQMDEYDKAAIITFGELIVEECIAVIREKRAYAANPQQIAECVEKHFEEPTEETKKKIPSLTYDQLVAAGIIRPNERELIGEERDSIMQSLLHLVPYMTTNNQRFITDHFDYGGMKYQVTYMEDDTHVIEIDPTWKATK